MADQPKPRTAEQLNPKNFSATGGQIDGQRYNVGMMQYPGLVGTKEYPHYVCFFINIRGKSKYKSQYKTTEVSGAGENRFDRAQTQKNLNTATTLAGGALGAKAGFDVGSKVAANMGQTSGKAKALGVALTTVAGGLVGATAANAVSNYFEGDKTYRIDSAIMLAVNERPSVQYQVEYQSQDMGTLAGVIAGGTSVIDSGFLDAGGEAARAALLNVAQIPSGIASAFGSNFDYKAMASVGTGTAMNPFREQVFQNVQTRTFNFEYKFLPRDANESKSVQNIIKMFKFHMHPELSEGGLFYIYPSEFNIVYYFNNDQNPYVHKISTCVLQSMNVDYGGQGQFTSFADGSPTEINMRLQFVELEVLTKERIASGY
jgi:hypothetical protein